MCACMRACVYVCVCVFKFYLCFSQPSRRKFVDQTSSGAVCHLCAALSSWKQCSEDPSGGGDVQLVEGEGQGELVEGRMEGEGQGELVEGRMEGEGQGELVEGRMEGEGRGELVEGRMEEGEWREELLQLCLSIDLASC